MNEAQLQQAVIELARLLGWRVAHFRPAMTAKGWRTPVEGDGKGFPDLVLVRGTRLIFAELKSDHGRLSIEQQEWNHWLILATPEVYVWTPEKWSDGRVEAMLR